MHFPESERIRFGEDTIVEVICQLRFPRILTIGTRPPDTFQEEIRAAYPVYRKQGGIPAPAEIAAIVEQLAVGPGPDVTTHWFEAENGERAISLATDFVAITARKYPGWEKFRAEIARAVDALEKTYAPSFFARIGLRYRDVIDRERLGLTDRPWVDLLHEGLVTLLGADLNIEPGRDRVRTDALLHLDEPAHAQVHLVHGVGSHDDHTYDLDADFFIEQTTDKGEALALLDRLNREEGHFFRWAIRPVLRDALGVVPGD